MANRLNFNPFLYAKNIPNLNAEKEKPSFLERAKRVLSFTPKQSCLQEIEYFKEILISDRFIEVGSASSSGKPSPQSKDVFGKPTLNRLIARLKALSKAPRENYNIPEGTFRAEHLEAFEALIQELEQEIQFCNEHKADITQENKPLLVDGKKIKKVNGRYYVQVGSNTKAKTELFLNKLYELNYAKMGFLQSGVDFMKNPPPMLVLLDESLKNLHSELLNYPPNSKKLEQYFNTVTRSLVKPSKLVPGFKPNANDLKLIRDFQKAFKDHFSLLESLKKDERFSPSYYELNLHLNRLKDLITRHINRSLPKTQQGAHILKSAVSGASYSLLSNAVPDQLKKALSYFSGAYQNLFSSKTDLEKPHPFIVFHDALDYFQKDNCFYNEKEKRDFLNELYNETADNFPGIKDKLLQKIQEGQNAPCGDLTPFDSFDLNQLTQIQETLHAYVKELTPELEETISVIDRIYVLTKTPLHTESGHNLKTYIEDILKLLDCNQPGIFKEPVKMATKTLKYFLDQALNLTIKDKDKTALTEIKDQVNTLIDEALSEDSIEGYRRAFSKLLDYYQKHQIYFGFLELPSFKNTEDATNVPDELITSALAKSKDSTFKKKSATILNSDVDRQRLSLGKNITHYLLFETLFYNVLGEKKNAQNEKKYYELVETLKNITSPKQKKDVFLKKLRKLINASSKSSFKKYLTKFLLSKLSYSFINEKMDAFTKKLLSFLRNNLSHLEGSPFEPISPHIIETLDECSSQYQLMLEKWAKTGGNKERSIKKLMKKSTYNVGVKGSYSEKELHKSASNAATKAFVETINTKTPWKNLFKRYYKLVDLSGPHNTAIKKIRAVAKVFFKIVTYIPVATLYYSGLLITTAIDKVISLILIRGITKSLENSHTIENLIDSLQESVYKKNPYVDIVTDFLIDNLEDLYILLHNENLDKERELRGDSIRYDREALVKIPPKTRAKLHQAIQNCFQMLDKNRYQTSDQLKHALRDTNNPSIMRIKTSLEESLDEQIIPEVVESLIDIIALSADELFKKKHLDKQLFRTLEQMNESLTNQPDQKSKNIKKLNQIYYQNEMHLVNLWDKVTEKIISRSVEDKFDQFGDRNYRETENQKVWIQDRLLKNNEDPLDQAGLITEWSNALSDLTLRQHEILRLHPENLEIYKETANSLKLEIESFFAQLSLRFEKIKKSSLSKRSLEQLNKQLKQLATALSNYSDNGISKLYQNSQFLNISKRDLENTNFLNDTATHISDQLEQLSNDQVDLSLKILSNISLFEERISSTLDEVLSNSDTTAFDNQFSELKEFFKSSIEMNFIRSELKKVEFLFGKQRYIESTLAEEFNEFLNAKEAEIDATNSDNSFFKRKLSAAQKKSTTLYNSLKSSLQNLITDPNEASRFIDYLEKVDKTNHLHKLRQNRLELSDHLKAIKEHFHINELSINLIKTALLPLKIRTEALIENVNDRHHILIEEFKKLTGDDETDSLKALLEKIKKSAEELKSIDHIHIPIKALDNVKAATKALVYSRIKPRADAAIDLLKEENFALFAINHFALIPLKESKYG